MSMYSKGITEHELLDLDESHPYFHKLKIARDQRLVVSRLRSLLIRMTSFEEVSLNVFTWMVLRDWMHHSKMDATQILESSAVDQENIYRELISNMKQRLIRIQKHPEQKRKLQHAIETGYDTYRDVFSYR